MAHAHAHARSRTRTLSFFTTLPFLGLFAATALTPACDASIETADGVSTSDPLYAEVKVLCAPDSLVMRVIDLEEDEALCCLDYESWTPAVHCMSKSGAQVTNPNSQVKFQKVIEANKAAKQRKKTVGQ